MPYSLLRAFLKTQNEKQQSVVTVCARDASRVVKQQQDSSSTAAAAAAAAAVAVAQRVCAISDPDRLVVVKKRGCD